MPIKIGPFDYTVEFTNAQEINGFDHEKWGDCRGDKLRIRIHEQAEGQVAIVVLVHEMLHALEFLMGKDIGEDVIRPLAPLLISALEDNGINLAPFHKIIGEARK
jgi:hypothetical protein